jgi:hypothetical protein
MAREICTHPENRGAYDGYLEKAIPAASINTRTEPPYPSWWPDAMKWNLAVWYAVVDQHQDLQALRGKR